ncbi:nucleotide exchange factor GrpE [Brevibacterium litoralis]|uniref:nucleotide exchange factor GrpE n=1 Tax=Brevibacterium litoralis TaxID=3138935 RepID=UPI0032EB3E9B
MTSGDQDPNLPDENEDVPQDTSAAEAPADSQPDADSASAQEDQGASGAGESAEADASDLGVEIPEDASELDGMTEEEKEADRKTAAGYLADLQRINAEYAAYRMRAQREQERAKESGIVKVVESLVPVLDEVKLARDNGDVTGPFETHVAKLESALEKLGVTQYGEPGDEFDPNLHEALMQQPNEEVETTTVFMVMQPGYKVGDRVVRAARVGVHAPAE